MIILEHRCFIKSYSRTPGANKYYEESIEMYIMIFSLIIIEVSFRFTVIRVFQKRRASSSSTIFSLSLFPPITYQINNCKNGGCEEEKDR